MSLRLLSCNIAFGGQDRLSLISGVIRVQQPDAVALLEANSRPHAQQLATELGMHLVFGESNSPFHVAWLSRPAPVSWTNHRLAVLDQTLLEIKLVWENAPLFLFALHLPAGRWRKDDEQRVREMQAILSILHQRTGSGTSWRGISIRSILWIPPDLARDQKTTWLAWRSTLVW